MEEAGREVSGRTEVGGRATEQSGGPYQEDPPTAGPVRYPCSSPHPELKVLDSGVVGSLSISFFSSHSRIAECLGGAVAAE
jgi:hypothetical protein